MKVKDHYLFLNDDHQITFKESPNQYQDAFVQPFYLMMHYTADPRCDIVISTFKNPREEKSAHIVIDVDGSLVQMVRFDKIAWHAGKKSHWEDLKNMNYFSIGIELVNGGKLRRLANGTWSIEWFNFSIPDDKVVLLKHKHENKKAGWHIYSEKQINIAIDVARALHENYCFKDILGHDDVRPGEKVDPGPAFHLENFKSKVFARQ